MLGRLGDLKKKKELEYDEEVLELAEELGIDPIH
jgi:hypothetical protein